MKVKVHISNRMVFLDPMVFALVELPAVPRIGENVYLKDETRLSLEQKAVLRPGWKGAYADFVDPMDPGRVNLTSANCVAEVAYVEGEPYVSLELHKDS